MRAVHFGWAAFAGIIYAFVMWVRAYAHGGSASDWAYPLGASAVLAVIASILSSRATTASWSGAIAAAGAATSIKPYVSVDSGHAIAVSGDGSSILLFTKVGESITSRAVTSRDVLGSEVFEDGDTVISASAGRTLAGAAVGGLLFGGAGAVVGGLTGNKTSAQRVAKIELRLTLNDMLNPVFDIVFLDTETAKSSVVYKSSSQEARDWHGRVSVLLNQGEK